MIVFTILLFAVLIASAQLQKPGTFNKNYISKQSTLPIKGLFVLIIFFNHVKGYIPMDNAADLLYLDFRSHIGQLMVVMFFFYSGYGILEQIKKYNFSYVRTIPRNRFLNLLLNYNLALIPFIIIFLFKGNSLTLQRVLGGIVAYSGYGNSNWFIFSTLLLYIITFISFLGVKRFSKSSHIFIMIVLTTALTGALAVGMYYLEFNEEWYNTILLYPLGMLYSFFKDKIEKIITKNDAVWGSAFLVCVIAYAVGYYFVDGSLLIYEAWAGAFTVGIVLATMKMSFNSRILDFFGEHVFSIYILQRLPMIILSDIGFFKDKKYLFVVTSLVITVIIAYAFDVLTGKISKKIRKKIT